MKTLLFLSLLLLAMVVIVGCPSAPDIYYVLESETDNSDEKNEEFKFNLPSWIISVWEGWGFTGMGGSRDGESFLIYATTTITFTSNNILIVLSDLSPPEISFPIPQDFQENWKENGYYFFYVVEISSDIEYKLVYNDACYWRFEKYDDFTLLYEAGYVGQDPYLSFFLYKSD